MWAVGRIDLGLTDAQFWRGLTFGKFHALADRIEARQEAENKRVQLLGFYMATFMGASKEEGVRFTPQDFGLGDGTSAGSASGGMPSLEEFLAGEERGRKMLEALERGEKNPFPSNPGVETQVEMMRQFAEVQNESI